MKTFGMTTVLICAAILFGCAFINKSNAASENRTRESNVFSKDAPVAPDVEPTPPANKNKTTNNSKSQSNKTLPQKVDDETAYSPVYDINSKNCKNRDEQGGEGEDFVRVCKGWGGYSLDITGMDYRKNYSIASVKESFRVMLFPLENGEAEKYVRADLYDEKIGDKIEWRLDQKGQPYAVIVRVFFYKNIGSAKTFNNPKNKVAEFLLVRGLAGYEDLKADIPTTGTAYDPNEQARMLAAKYLEKHQK